MIYQMYQAQADLMAPIRAVAGLTAAMLRSVPAPFRPFWTGHVGAAYELLARSGFTHARPPFGIDTVAVADLVVPVVEEAVDVTPFGTLLHFKKQLDAAHPRVLVVAPMSGHFATLLRGTVRTMLPEHDVYITDWHNARDVGLAHGRFGIDEYVDHLIRFMNVLGPGAHVVAVCQPCVPVLAAVALMAESNHPAQPRSMTLMAGPIDARVNPTKVNQLAASHSLEWFERNVVTTVPMRYEGAMRRVYPGFLQLTAFLSMNPERHLKAHGDLYGHLAGGATEKARALEDFYDEYFAVLDLTAEFYLETVRSIFQEYELARGVLDWHGRRVDPGAIDRTALLTVEGERDDVCGIGQTMAAQDLCTGLRPYLKRHHLQPGVGHYGVFSGARWTRQIYPALRNLILSND